MTAICAIPWDADRIRPWIDGHGVEALTDSAEPTGAETKLDPVVSRVLDGMNPNLNNVLTSGTEKDIVAGRLLGLHDKGYSLDVNAIKTWAVRRGWPGKRVEELGKLASEIQSGKRPRVRERLREGWLERIEADLHSE